MYVGAKCKIFLFKYVLILILMKLKTDCSKFDAQERSTGRTDNLFEVFQSQCVELGCIVKYAIDLLSMDAVVPVISFSRLMFELLSSFYPSIAL
jgi:hypothetical protein